MINRDRIVNEFMELVKIDSLSRKERAMADVLKNKLNSMGYDAAEDEAGVKIGGDTGNIICSIIGTLKVPAILLMAHMDTVVPGIGKKPHIEDGYIVSDGTTILGGDDVSGIECILEALRVLKEDKIEHGDIQIAFTVAEEVGLLGAKNLDYSKIYAKYAMVLDCGGPIGTIAVKAPSQYIMKVTVNGKAAHAGMEPEKGVSAIEIASKAIAAMKLGRIDSETTANIGTIKGGLATNIVCDKVEIEAEARSRNQEKLEMQKEHMKKCFEDAAAELGGSINFISTLEYTAFNISNDSEIIANMKTAADFAGIELIMQAIGGGSDTNIVNGKGIQAVAVSSGMDRVHSVGERILIEDMVKCAKFLVEIIKAVK